MSRVEVCVKLAFGSILGCILLVAGGCGGDSAPTEADKEHAVNQSQARAAAYGKGGVASASTPGSMNRQAAARRGGR